MMSNTFEEFNKYSFIAINPDGSIYRETCPDTPIETASSIKSPMANVALRHANNVGLDTNNYTMAVTEEHIPSNATTFMQNSLGEHFSLTEVIERTIVQSDATATNMLIDFIGGRDAVNEGLDQIGLGATQLLQEKLDFTELQRPNPNPIFGVSTVRQLAEYYRNLIGNPNDQKWTKDFITLHGLLKNVRLFSTKAAFLLPDTSFLHKTGSIFSTDIPQASIVDAGKLTTGKFPEGIFVAASFAVYRNSGLRGINTEFSETNCNQLGISRNDVCDHPLPEKAIA